MKNTMSQEELAAQKRAAFAAGVLLGDVSIQTLLQSIPGGVVIVESGGRIILTNTRAEELFGYAKDELIGQPIEMLLPEAAQEGHRRQVAKYFANPQNRPMAVGRSVHGIRQDGEELSLEVSLGHVPSPAGPLGLALVADLEVRRQAEAELRKSREDLEVFARTIAHDLTGSLSGLVAASDLLAGAKNDSSMTARLIDEIGATSRNLVTIVREVLASATLTADIEPAPLDMAAIVYRAMDRLKLVAKKRGARFVVQADMPSALGQGPYVEEMWFNYLANAIKYGGEKPVIEIGGEAGAEGKVRFWVQDKGPGVPPEERDSLFRTGQGDPGAAGHGLGLPIVARFAERLEGEVFVESDPETGSRFGFVLPAAGRSS